MNDCERFEELLSAYLDGELGADEETELKAHLANCPDCAAMFEAFSAVSGAVRAQDVPDTLHSRIMETVRAAEKASRTQRVIIRLRPILAAAACLIVLVGTVFALKNTTGFGRSAMKSADAAPMEAEGNAMIMAAGSNAADEESAAENSTVFESKMEMPAAVQADMATAESDNASKATDTEGLAMAANCGSEPGTAAFFSDADAVIARSALIVRAEKTGEEPAADGDGTLSHVTVQEVVQATDAAQAEAGSVIDVLEPDETDGYLKMKTGKQYLLFLDYDPACEAYEPVDPLCGKLPWDPEEPLFSDGETEQAEQVMGELRQRFLPEPGE